ncbi:hypothetical protein Tco_1018880 [Tanacetum coccineum]|uniref:Uncharacterized protein n=1 Tax=Tanacetum coccineum TaxID=301880 RepID=A0ABQ5FVK6_9ASTR
MRGSHWSKPTRIDTRIRKEAHQEVGFYTELLVKEAQRGLTHGMPCWQSMCSLNDPTVIIEDPMIGRFRLKGVCNRIKASHDYYKYKLTPHIVIVTALLALVLKICIYRSSAPQFVLSPFQTTLLAKQVYRKVSKKNNVNTSGNKKNDVEPTIEVIKSNPGETSNLASKKPILVNPRSGMWILVVLGKPLTMINFSGDHDSEDEVASVDNDMAKFLASKDVGYGQDIPDKIQDICDNLDIKVRGRKKK